MKEGLNGTNKTVSFKEELIEKILSSLNEDSINFIKNNQVLFKTGYSLDGDYKKIGLSLDGLIDENKYQIFPNRPIYFKEGLPHLKLLLSMSSRNEIKSFYKKVQNKKIIDPDNPDHAEIANILDSHLSASDINKRKPSPKVSLELLKNLEQMTIDSMKQNCQILANAKTEYHQYTQKIKNTSSQFKDKLKVKYEAENELLKINEENKRMNALNKALTAGKKRLRQLKVRIDLYARYVDLEQKEKILSELSPKIAGKEKAKYAHLLECFRDRKVEVKNVWMEIQRFSNNRNEVNKKYSNVSEALSQLERSLEKDIAYKDNLMKEIKSFSSYAEYLDLEQEEKNRMGAQKSKSSSSLKANGQEKIKYRQLLESFKRQKIEVKKIRDEIQKFGNKSNRIRAKYSIISEELLKTENSLKNDTVYKNSLVNEIKSLTHKVKEQKSDLEILNKLSGSHYSLQSCILIESNRTKEDLEVQGRILDRYNANKNNIYNDFNLNKNRYDADFSEISKGMKKLYKQLDTVHLKNRKILKQADSFTNKILKNRERFEDIKNEFSDQLSPRRAEKFLRIISKNRKQLVKTKNRSDEFEEDLSAARLEKDDKLFSLKEIGERHSLLASKWQIFVELTKEKVLDSENLLMGIYEKLTGLKIELATTFELLEISCVCNDEIFKIIFNIHKDIENMRKNILQEIQGARESLEDEERIVSLFVKEQQSVKEKYKEFSCKFNGPYLNRGDLEVLLYQNTQLEKKLNDFFSKEALDNNGTLPVFKSSDYAKALKDGLKSKLDAIAIRKGSFNFVPRLAGVESSTLMQTGVAAFLVLCFLSYLFVYNTDNIYDYKKSLLAFNLSTVDYNDNNFGNKIKGLSNARDMQNYNEKINLFNENNSIGIARVENRIEKINTLKSDYLNIIPASLFPESGRDPIMDDGTEIENINTLWANYSDIFNDLRFDSPSNAFRLFEMMMNRQALDLTLMDSVQLLYSIRRVLKSEEGLFFDRMFNEFINLGYEKKEATLNILHNNKLIDEIYNKNIHHIYKGGLKPIAILEEMNMKDFEEIVTPYIIVNYKTFARAKNIPVPGNIKIYAGNLAQDIYICAKKFHVPVTSLLTIAHQESFFISLLGDNGKSASPFQIYQPTKHRIFKSMKNDGFKIPEKVSNLENHVTFATFIAAYHFAGLVKNYASPIIDPISHKPTALIINLRKSTRFYNGGKRYDRKVLLKQKELENYLKHQINKIPVAS